MGRVEHCSRENEKDKNIALAKNSCETWRIEGVGVTQEALEEVGVSPPRLLRRSDRFRTWVDRQLGIILDR